MSFFKAAILLLVAVAATEASVRFADSESNVYWVDAASNACHNFPAWINDRATTYEIKDNWQCIAYLHGGCSGDSAYLYNTNWKKLPFTGVSSVKCWKD
ncbi:MAG: hypothetical protein JOS17DRAFT_732278 [Linnemannia elongata]|nr:MAG: hypothetical protein JOS17DRAFT_732275 [Linnemannia elongata]KAK3837956.1 MAG: hypothetical protein JOS17DRAFT_732278 [Linnemannia elongata]